MLGGFSQRTIEYFTWKIRFSDFAWDMRNVKRVEEATQGIQRERYQWQVNWVWKQTKPERGFAVEIVLYCRIEGGFACAQAGCPDCLNALLREREKLVHFVIGGQRLGQAEWADLAQVWFSE